jgi:hypothetical protein
MGGQHGGGMFTVSGVRFPECYKCAERKKSFLESANGVKMWTQHSFLRNYKKKQGM